MTSGSIVHRVALVAALLLYSRFTAGAERAAAQGDAYVSHEASSDLWTIGNRDLTLIIGFNANRTLTLRGLSNPVTKRIWDIADEPDTAITIDGERVVLGGGGSTAFLGATAEATEQGVRLTFEFEHRARRARIFRIYACYPGSPTIETWTRIDTSKASEPVAFTNLTAWTMMMPIATVKFLGGLRGDAADVEESGAFALAERHLEPDERVEIGSDRRSSEQFVPFALVDDGRDEFFGGIQWSGAWRMAFERHEQTLRLTIDFPGVSTFIAPGRRLELPHAFFGVAPRSTTSESAALRNFIISGIRGGRPLRPLVTYNTWFAYGSRIDEDLMVSAIDRAASLGVELFVVDAGWYVGAGTNSEFDFESGLGDWSEDGGRFPSGLASLADYTHDRGMLFGLWVEPERVALATVSEPGLARESWLATHDGSYGSAASAQICLTPLEARQWVVDRLVALIDAVRPDYLKWDNNFWINCNRPGHGHGDSDGNFTHVQALYSVLEEIRRRYPDLLIENVSGGGNRLDFGMMAYTDVGWMSDRSAPATRVRHNLEGLSTAFPPDYLLSFVIEDQNESLHDPDLRQLVVRSRLPGVLGMTFRAEDVNDDDLAAELRTEIDRYKYYRNLLGEPNATLLTDQAPVELDSWDVLQETSADASAAVIFAFKGDSGDGSIVVRPRYLLPDATYDVESVDVGPLGAVTGDLLMKDGIELIHRGTSQAHLIVLTAR